MKYKEAKAEYYDRITAKCPYCHADYLDEYPRLWKYEFKGEQVRCLLCKKIFIIKL